jgi:hypothetical protein
LVYFLNGIKKDPVDGFPPDSAWQFLHFHNKFPVTQIDFPREGRIPALDLLSTIFDLVRGSSNLGKSQSNPLPIQVLADRQTQVFFESSGRRRTIGNVFKISNLFILKGE